MPVHLERQIRRLILALLVLGLVGTVVELLALGHYKDSWQSVPLGLMAATLMVIAWHLFNGNAASVRALRVAMLLVLIVGGIGVALHYRGGLEFQVDANPDLAGWGLLLKVLHAKAPPALAPGSMAELGLLGLIYTFRHPALRGKDQ